MTSEGPALPSPGSGVLHLDRKTVEEACSSLDELRQAIRDAFSSLAAGEADALPKAALNLAHGHFFQAMVAADRRSDLAAVKWVGVVPNDGTNAIHTSMMLSRRSTGELIATMDAAPITAARTAAMSAIAAQRLARPDSRSIAFIGCGTQARSHLAALRRVLPEIEHVSAYSRRLSTASDFADEARQAGFSAEAMDDPRAAIAHADVVVSAVPIGAPGQPFIDARWLRPGTFLAAVDLANPWQSESLDVFDIVATDDVRQSEHLVQQGRMKFAGKFDADLSRLCTAAHTLRTSSEQRTLFVFAGHALADLAAAGLVYRHATRAKSAG